MTTPTFNANGTLTVNGTVGSGGPVTTTTQAWLVGGNTLAATGVFGTLSNNHVDFYTNNVVRGRYSNLGEFFVGTTTTALAGDLMNAVGNATFPWAVNGYTTQNGSGVYGAVQNPSISNYSAIEGAYQGLGNGSGVYGNNVSAGTGNGVTGNVLGAGIGIGVFGGNYSTVGTAPAIGVEGYSDPNISGNQRIGVYGTYDGVQHFGLGVVGVGFGGGIPAGNNDIAVVGWVANNTNYSGYFNGNHVVVNGTKSASVATSKGNQLLYVTESPEVWFEDIGHGQLVNGEVTVELDPLFLETVVIDEEHPMEVFVQVQGECNDVYVVPGTTSFTVKEKNSGQSNVSFSYRIMAKRKNFQDHRFGNDPVWGPGDTREYAQYSPPPPVDYYENVRFQEERKRNYRPTPMPAGFSYFVGVPAETFQARPVGESAQPIQEGQGAVQPQQQQQTPAPQPQPAPDPRTQPRAAQPAPAVARPR